MPDEVRAAWERMRAGEDPLVAYEGLGTDVSMLVTAAPMGARTALTLRDRTADREGLPMPIDVDASFGPVGERTKLPAVHALHWHRQAVLELGALTRLERTGEQVPVRGGGEYAILDMLTGWLIPRRLALAVAAAGLGAVAWVVHAGGHVGAASPVALAGMVVVTGLGHQLREPLAAGALDGGRTPARGEPAPRAPPRGRFKRAAGAIVALAASTVFAATWHDVGARAPARPPVVARTRGSGTPAAATPHARVLEAKRRAIAGRARGRSEIDLAGELDAVPLAVAHWWREDAAGAPEQRDPLRGWGEPERSGVEGITHETLWWVEIRVAELHEALARGTTLTIAELDELKQLEAVRARLWGASQLTVARTTGLTESKLSGLIVHLVAGGSPPPGRHPKVPSIDAKAALRQFMTRRADIEKRPFALRLSPHDERLAAKLEAADARNHGMTLNEAAALAGVSEFAVSQWAAWLRAGAPLSRFSGRTGRQRGARISLEPHPALIDQVRAEPARPLARVDKVFADVIDMKRVAVQARRNGRTAGAVARVLGAVPLAVEYWLRQVEAREDGPEDLDAGWTSPRPRGTKWTTSLSHEQLWWLEVRIAELREAALRGRKLTVTEADELAQLEAIRLRLLGESDRAVLQKRPQVDAPTLRGRYRQFLRQGTPPPGRYPDDATVRSSEELGRLRGRRAEIAADETFLTPRLGLHEERLHAKLEAAAAELHGERAEALLISRARIDALRQWARLLAADADVRAFGGNGIHKGVSIPPEGWRTAEAADLDALVAPPEPVTRPQLDTQRARAFRAWRDAVLAGLRRSVPVGEIAARLAQPPADSTGLDDTLIDRLRAEFDRDGIERLGRAYFDAFGDPEALPEPDQDDVFWRFSSEHLQEVLRRQAVSSAKDANEQRDAAILADVALKGDSVDEVAARYGTMPARVHALVDEVVRDLPAGQPSQLLGVVGIGLALAVAWTVHALGGGADEPMPAEGDRVGVLAQSRHDLASGAVPPSTTAVALAMLTVAVVWWVAYRWSAARAAARRPATPSWLLRSRRALAARRLIHAQATLNLLDRDAVARVARALLVLAPADAIAAHRALPSLARVRVWLELTTMEEVLDAHRELAEPLDAEGEAAIAAWAPRRDAGALAPGFGRRLETLSTAEVQVLASGVWRLRNRAREHAERELAEQHHTLMLELMRVPDPRAPRDTPPPGARAGFVATFTAVALVLPVAQLAPLAGVAMLLLAVAVGVWEYRLHTPRRRRGRVARLVRAVVGPQAQERHLRALPVEAIAQGAPLPGDPLPVAHFTPDERGAEAPGVVLWRTAVALGRPFTRIAAPAVPRKVAGQNGIVTLRPPGTGRTWLGSAARHRRRAAALLSVVGELDRYAVEPRGRRVVVVASGDLPVSAEQEDEAPASGTEIVAWRVATGRSALTRGERARLPAVGNADLPQPVRNLATWMLEEGSIAADVDVVRSAKKSWDGIELAQALALNRHRYEAIDGFSEVIETLNERGTLDRRNRTRLRRAIRGIRQVGAAELYGMASGQHRADDRLLREILRPAERVLAAFQTSVADLEPDEYPNGPIWSGERGPVGSVADALGLALTDHDRRQFETMFGRTRALVRHVRPRIRSGRGPSVGADRGRLGRRHQHAAHGTRGPRRAPGRRRGRAPGGGRRAGDHRDAPRRSRGGRAHEHHPHRARPDARAESGAPARRTRRERPRAAARDAQPVHRLAGRARDPADPPPSGGARDRCAGRRACRSPASTYCARCRTTAWRSRTVARRGAHDGVVARVRRRRAAASGRPPRRAPARPPARRARGSPRRARPALAYVQPRDPLRMGRERAHAARHRAGAPSARAGPRPRTPVPGVGSRAGGRQRGRGRHPARRCRPRRTPRAHPALGARRRPGPRPGLRDRDMDRRRPAARPRLHARRSTVGQSVHAGKVEIRVRPRTLGFEQFLPDLRPQLRAGAFVALLTTVVAGLTVVQPLLMHDVIASWGGGPLGTIALWAGTAIGLRAVIVGLHLIGRSVANRVDRLASGSPDDAPRTHATALLRRDRCGRRRLGSRGAARGRTRLARQGGRRGS